MGYTYTSRDDLSAREAYRRASHTAFAHTAAMSATPSHLRTIHDSVDPKGRNHAGARVRECLDSKEHPLTTPAVVGFDETGSMGEAPMILQTKLAQLKGATLRAGLSDLQLSFAAYGDASYEEVAPCQVGQFESGIEMEDYLNNLYLEGLGGGNNGESSGLLLYFLARHSRLDSVDKRHERGYLILIGDESPLPVVTAEQARRYVGDDIESDLTIEQVVAEVTKLYDVYFFHWMTGAARIQNSLAVWQKLLGRDHVVPLQSLDTVSEQITMLIAYLEGVTDTIDGAGALLLAEGADPIAVRSAGQAMVRFGGGQSPAARATGLLPKSDTPPDTISRL